MTIRARRRDLLALGALATAGAVLPFRRTLAQARRPMPDVVVVLPGIMGSVLQRSGKDVWALSGSALARGLVSLGGSVKSLTLSEDSAEATSLDDGISATALLPDTHLLPGLWKIDGYTKLTKTLRNEFDLRPGENYFEFAYDWRRDNRAAARRLATLSRQWLRAWRAKSGNPDARLILLAHSMGGLVSRYFLEVLEGWRDTRTFVTFGTPYRGSLNALNFLVNGMKKTAGSLTLIDLSTMLRSFTSIYQLLPIYPCYDAGDAQLKRVMEATGFPQLDLARVRSAFQFHEEIRLAVERNFRDSQYLNGRYTIHPIVGTYQSTLLIGKRAGSGMQMLGRDPRNTQLKGDGTVPQVSARPIEPEVLAQRQRVVYAAELHGSLQNCTPVLDHVVQLLAEGYVDDTVYRAGEGKEISLNVDDFFGSNEVATATVGCEDRNSLIVVTVVDVGSRQQVARKLVDDVGSSGAATVSLGKFREGTYRVRAQGADGGSANDVFLVMDS